MIPGESINPGGEEGRNYMSRKGEEGGGNNYIMIRRGESGLCF